MKKIAELKEQVYRCWTYLSQFNDAVVQPENFKADVRKFGDLRRKQTWIDAYCRFWAQNIFDSNSDNRTLVRVMFNFKPDQWDYELRHQILDEFLAIPEASDCLKDGLEEVFGNPVNQQEKEAAYGVFELVQKSTGELRGITVEPTWRLNACS